MYIVIKILLLIILSILFFVSTDLFSLSIKYNTNELGDQIFSIVMFLIASGSFAFILHTLDTIIPFTL